MNFNPTDKSEKNMWSAPKSSLKKSDDSKLEQKNKITINIWLPRVNDETVSAESFLKK